MRNSTPIILLLLFYTYSGNAQNQINGILVDKNSGTPIQYATVYINDTSNGTISNSNGNFLLKHSNFPCKLIIRHVGYERVVFNLDKGIDLKKVNLKPQIQAINEIQIEAKNHRKENLQLFREAFLGVDHWGKKAKIANEDDIKFYRKNSIETKFGKEFTLIAHSEVPIKIHIPLLGYWLDFDLVMFELNPISQAYQGYYYYQPIENLNRRKVKTILKNRERVYYNSSMHFVRSLYNHCPNKQGYLVFRKSLNIEKSEQQYIPIQLDSLLVESKSSSYFEDLKKQQFHIFYYHTAKEKPFDLTSEIKRPSNPKQSEITFLGDSCAIRKDGTLPDVSTMFSGTIGIKHIGASLPADYSPPANINQ